MKKKEVENWVKNHKKELIIAGVGIGFVIATIAAIKNKDALEALFASLKKSTEMPDSPVTIVRACQMTEMGMQSDPGLTGGDAYETGIKVA